MRFAARLFLPSLALVLITSFVTLTPAAHAAEPFAVSVSAGNEPLQPGQTAVFRIRVEGQIASLPSFDYDVQGGTLTGVSSLDPTAANVAEGAVFVTRDSAGMATVSVRFGSAVLASGSARFGATGNLSVNVSLNAGPDAAARTWRYEVVSTSGQVVATLTANTSGDSPAATVTAANLPYGFYTVRQVLGGDTRTSCDGGSFYQVQAPVSAETTIELASASASVVFTIAPCPGIPDIDVSIPIDTIGGTGTVGDADVEPGLTPVSEVRGTRQEGPGNPLPPSAGNAQLSAPISDSTTMVILLLGAFGLMAPGAGMLVLAQRGRRRR